MAKNCWIRTINGWAGRKGYIMPNADETVDKYALYYYGSSEPITSSKIGELKRLADAE